MREYFPRLLGNTDARSRVGAAIERGRSAHAFLIGGARGSGRMTLATEIAAALNCKRRSDTSAPLPCGRCENCLRIYGGSFTDVKITRKPADRATLGVALIKDLREDMFLSATESEHKVYIIADAECMTVEAQNALLKVLEEPPSGVVIILIATEADKILTTIKSRVQFIATERFTTDELISHLVKMSDVARRQSKEDPERLRAIAMSADGRLGEAMLLSEEKGAQKRLETRAEVLALIRAAISHSFTEVRAAVSALPTKRAELSEYLEMATVALRDMIAVKCAPNVRCIFFVSAKEAEQTSGGVTVGRLTEIYDIITDAYGYLTKNANIQSLTTSLAARLT